MAGLTFDALMSRYTSPLKCNCARPYAVPWGSLDGVSIMAMGKEDWTWSYLTRNVGLVVQTLESKSSYRKKESSHL